jgi:hypothetical protein
MVTSRHELLLEWDSDLRLICHAHYDVAVHLDRNNYSFGVPVVVLSVTVGTFTFASFGNETVRVYSLLVGLGSFAAAVLASLQTFLKLPERAERHRRAGALFGSLLKELEQITGSPAMDEERFRKWADAFRQRWDQVSQESPTIPRRFWRRHYEISKKPVADQRKLPAPGAS